MADEKHRTFTFNFSPQFIDRVAAGEKRQTIRASRKDGRVPRPGDRIRLYAGMRTRNCRLLADSMVVDCFPVVIDFDDYRPIISNGIRLHAGEANAFARLDGFPDSATMVEWFKKTHGGQFEGFCVCWRSP